MLRRGTRLAWKQRIAPPVIAAALALLLPPSAMGSGLVADGAQLWKAADLASGGGPPGAVFGSAVATGDFDGDGQLDLAIGDAFADVGGDADAGAVYVAYGSGAGVASAGSQVWTQDSGAMQNSAEPNDHFGFSLVSGNFNGDAYDDLAIGIPGETINGKVGAGAFAILFGSSPGGLTDTGNHFWHMDRNGIVGVAAAGDQYGYALAAGYFDADGYEDLAIGIPFSNATDTDSGFIQVFYGDVSGPTSAREENWEQGFNLPDVAEAGDNFGLSLAAGDFDDDGLDDLVVGVPFEDLPPQPGGDGTDVGALHVVLGSATGLTPTGSQFWHQRVGSVLGGFDGNEQFGTALAVGDFDGDGHDDLAIGAPGEPGSSVDAGWINVLFGAAGGLTDAGNQVFSQGFGGLLGTEGSGHRFGQALTSGDFDGDNIADVAVAAPGDVVAGAAGAGSATVIFGTALRLATTGNQYWTQADALVADTPEAGDAFGSALAAGDFDGDGSDDLALGVPAEDGVGAVNVLYGERAPLRDATDVNPDPDVFEAYLTADELDVQIRGTTVDMVVYKDDPPAPFTPASPGIPAPEISVKVGDTVIIHFKSDLETVCAAGSNDGTACTDDSACTGGGFCSNATSIHWHGIELDNNSDGTGVTQDQLYKGDEYVYRFQVVRPGLFWYHPHMRPAHQDFAGMYGPLIVRDADSTTDTEAALEAAGAIPSNVHTVVLSDIEFDATGKVGFCTPARDGQGVLGTCVGPDRSSVNEKIMACAEGLESQPPPHSPEEDCDIPHGGTVLVNGQKPNALGSTPRIVARSGEGIRLRLLNAAIARYFRLRFENGAPNADCPDLNGCLYRVGGEGGFLEEARLEGGCFDTGGNRVACPGSWDTKFQKGEIVLGPADRAEVVIVPVGAEGQILSVVTSSYPTNNKEIAHPLPTEPVLFIEIQGSESSPFSITEGADVLGADAIDNLKDLTIVNHAELPSMGGPGMADETIRLTALTPDGNFFGPRIDHIPGHLEDSGPDFSVIPHPESARFGAVGELLELTIRNETVAHHPFHLHGFSYQPVRILDSDGNTLYTFQHDEFIDNMDVQKQQQLVFRVALDDRERICDDVLNPYACTDSPDLGAVGRWVFHCHIFHHAALGMISELVVDDAPGFHQPREWLPEDLEPGSTAFQLGAALAHGDFNGDGYDDLAIGAPELASDAGEVHVAYGSATGLSDVDTDLWIQGQGGLGEAAELNDRFGAALASGDFDGDGYDDLAIGVPGESFIRLSDSTNQTNAGGVHVLRGSAGGLTATGSVFLTQDTGGPGGIPGIPATGDLFGFALATGRFDGDGYDDLAIGIPNKEDGATDSGIVQVLVGSATGLSTQGSTVGTLSQSFALVEDSADDFDQFGYALTSGDFDADGFDDLAVGVPNESFARNLDAQVVASGAVHVFLGDNTGLSFTGDVLWTYDSGISGVPETGDRFGEALTSGDFQGDGFGDLAIGVPERDDVSASAGNVVVLHGFAGGLTSSGEVVLSQGFAGTEGEAEFGDNFGAALASGDFDNDGFADLAVGVPGQDVPGFAQAGGVHVFFGSSAKLNDARDTLYFDWLSGTVGFLARFGSALTSGNFDGRGSDDLAVGEPGQVNFGGTSRGAVTALYGSFLCGNGILSAGEACDDNNLVSLDGCSSFCVVEARIEISGTPLGGIVFVTLDGVTVSIDTTGLSTPEQVAATLAAAIEAAGAAAAGATGAAVYTDGTLENLWTTDPGLSLLPDFGWIPVIPSLGIGSLLALCASLLGLGVWLARRSARTIP